MSHSISDHPKVFNYRPFQLYEHVFDKKPTYTRISECVAPVIANQWCMLYWKSHFNGNFIHFCTGDQIKSTYYTDEKKFKLLPYAPGGITNLGDFDMGEQNEFFVEDGATYELNIIVSPAIKIKTAEHEDHMRYPFTIYPFIKGKDRYNPEIKQDSYANSTDFHAHIIEGDICNIIKNRQWSLEHNFGIDVNLIKK